MPPTYRTSERRVGQTQHVVVPDEEIVEPIHMMLSPHQMACGAPEGIGVLGFDADRVTCEMCNEWLRTNRGQG